MKALHWLGAAMIATATLTPAAADAQRWGPGWHEWHGRAYAPRGWAGPGWYGRPGPHYGYYAWNGGWYRHCGWRWGPYGRRAWRCY